MDWTRREMQRKSGARCVVPRGLDSMQAEMQTVCVHDTIDYNSRKQLAQLVCHLLVLAHMPNQGVSAYS